MDEVQEIAVGRRSIPSAATLIVFSCLVGGAFLSTMLFGTDFWLPVLMILLALAAYIRGASGGVSVILCAVALGMYASLYLFGFWVWPSALLGMVAVLVIATHFLGSAGAENGDQNPIIYIAMIIGMRAFAALIYSTTTAITDDTLDFTDWLSLFVLGTLPDLPVVFNILLGIITTGTLVVYLTLLIKRIINPLAN